LWLVSRDRLLPHREPTSEEELAGHTVALLALGVASLLVVAVNPFALIFVLPSLHAWLWLPNLRSQALLARVTTVVLGFAGVALLVGTFAGRFGLGLDAPWYLAQLVAIGWVPLPLLAISVALADAAATLAAPAAGR